jgi:2-succinyl-6-hydroxy-2,4-cyclohexadiene-1-carboxylate synthase
VTAEKHVGRCLDAIESSCTMIDWVCERSRERTWLLVHGFAGGPESWMDVVASWSQPSTIAALVLPGHRRGIDVEQGAGFSGNLLALACSIRDAGLAGAHFVGYSLGARVVLGLLAEAPELVGRATLIGVHPGLGSEAERMARVADDRRWVEMLRGEGIEAFVEAWERLPLWGTQARVPAERRERQRAVRRGLDPEGLARSLEEMGLGAMPDYRGALRAAAARLPVRLVVGAEDVKFGAIAEGLAAEMPGLGLHRIAEAGHNPLIEQPEALARLLSETDGGAAW